ncbi:hypothetical protein [uncultured Roseibium sp.]|uniref:hypothetical protein n=1 Tax=uncultured Roseibium sp. TaxID=1936171 RepID=UPI00321690F7
MADYYSILKKTIGSLPENNGAARRGVYSRARNAIVNQLKAYEPPLSPSEITAEQLRLEEAIRKVEAEAARESLGLNPLSKPPAAPATSGTATLTARQEPTPPPAPAAEKAPAVQPAAPAPAAPASPLKQAVEEAEKLGAASHSAVLSTKEAISSTAETGVGSSQEPVMAAYEPEAETDAYQEEPHQDYTPNASSGYEVRHHTYDDDMDDDAETGRKGRGRKRLSDAVRRPGRGLSLVPLALIGVLILIVLGIAGVIYSQRDMISEMMAGGSSNSERTVADDKTVAPVTTEPRVAEDTADADKNGGKNTDRLLDDNGQPAAAPDARTVTTTTITPDQSSSTQAATPPAPAETVAPVASVPQTPEPAAPEPATPEPATPEVAAPVTTPSVPQIVASTGEGEKQDTPPAPEGTAAVAQRSILYEEGAGENGAGTASQGEVVWAIKEETDLDGKKQEILTAEVRIPERNVSVDIRLKPNEDSSLPASHLVEIKYNFPKDFPAGDVQNVPGLVMKPTEQARGDALIGASVKVSEGYFWIALSNISSERERNIGLLRERGWIDIPMLYDNGKRGILTLEKGPTGTKAVDEAVQAWQAG